MRNLIRSFVLVVLGFASAGAALADPKLLYGFSVDRYQCSGRACKYDFTDRLNQMGMGLLPSALTNGQASLNVAGSVITENSGVSFLNLFGGSSYPDGVLLEGGISYPGDYPYLRTRMQLEVGQFLTGFFQVGDASSDVVMASDRSRLQVTYPLDEALLYDNLGANEWTGYMVSDAFSGVIYFTGEWRFVGLVPEPGTMVLMLAALGGMALSSRRRI